MEELVRRERKTRGQSHHQPDPSLRSGCRRRRPREHSRNGGLSAVTAEGGLAGALSACAEARPPSAVTALRLHPAIPPPAAAKDRASRASSAAAPPGTSPRE